MDIMQLLDTILTEYTRDIWDIDEVEFFFFWPNGEVGQLLSAMSPRTYFCLFDCSGSN